MDRIKRYKIKFGYERPTIKSQAEKQKNKNNFLIKKGIANKLA